MDYVAIIEAWISKQHGVAVSEQFRDIADGESLEEMNPNAVRDIKEELEKLARAFDGDPLGDEAASALAAILREEATA